MSRKAEKIFEKMKNSKAGWHTHDFQTLYLGFGFKMVEAKNHTTFVHPDFPHLIDQIPRHADELPKAYAKDAVDNIETLKKLQSEAKDDE